MEQFNAKRVKDHVVEWIRDWFEENGKGCNAVLGVSGGKDSSIVAALLKAVIDDKHAKNLFKLKPIPYFEYKTDK